jgi:hypothetical protein
MRFVKSALVTRLILAVSAAFVAINTAPSNARSDELDIDLKLFRGADLPDNPTGCHFALWQKDRDPGTDKYAYLFFQPFSEDGVPLPARMRVGDTFLELNGIAQSTEETVNGLPRHLVYRSEKPRYRVLVELRESSGGGSMTPIDDAGIYVVRSDKLPFPASGKGQYGCPDIPEDSANADRASATKSAAAPEWRGPQGIPFGREQMLAGAAEVPPSLQQQLRDYAADDCYLDGPAPWPGSRYVINENYLLWQLPCFVAAYQGSSAFGITQNPPRDWAELLLVPSPPAMSGHETYSVMNPDTLNNTGIIRATEKGRGMGDCGVHKVYRLIDGPGEVLELELLEYREKTECDGVANAPESWPLVYRSY